MNAVFLDTVGMLALWDRTDQWHNSAEEAFRTVLDASEDIVTTTFILAECGNAAARRPYRLAVVRLRDELDAVDRLIRPDEADWNAAWTAYQRGDAAQAGIVDHISFSVMRRLGLTRAFTNDAHFRAAGFETLF